MSTLGVDPEVGQRRALRRMKAGATGLLLFATAVYVAATRWQRHGGPGWVGYVAAATEAGMVGGLADWFAVTALFRRPLGLPIPHTAIIPTRKDALGRGLEQFVSRNFLAEDVVREKVAAADVAGRVGGWLARPANAERVTRELAAAVRGAFTVLRDEDVQDVLERTVLRRVVDRPWGPPAGALLGRVVAEGTHHRLVDLAVAEGHRWLLDNRERVIDVVAEQSPAWSPRFLDDRIAGKVWSELTRVAAEVEADQRHGFRLALDGFLARFADDLRTDPATIARAEQIKEKVVAHPEVRKVFAAVWATTRSMVLDAVGDPDSELRRKVDEGLAAFGARLGADPDLRAKADRWISDAASHLVGGYRDEVATIIGDTVGRWDGAETSGKIEVAVGRDLQFIRINGTVVGALAGLVIHAVSTTLL